MGPLDEAENRGDFPLYHKKEVPARRRGRQFVGRTRRLQSGGNIPPLCFFAIFSRETIYLTEVQTMNYFNSIPMRRQLEEIGHCRFMEHSEFSRGQ